MLYAAAAAAAVLIRAATPTAAAAVRAGANGMENHFLKDWNNFFCIVNKLGPVLGGVGDLPTTSSEPLFILS